MWSFCCCGSLRKTGHPAADLHALVPRLLLDLAKVRPAQVGRALLPLLQLLLRRPLALLLTRLYSLQQSPNKDLLDTWPRLVTTELQLSNM